MILGLIRVQRKYRNAVTQQTLGAELHDEFIECLTHDSLLMSADNKLRAKGIGEAEALDMLNLTTPPGRG